MLHGVCLLLCVTLCVCSEGKGVHAMYGALIADPLPLHHRKEEKEEDSDGILEGTSRCDSRMTTGSQSYFGI